MLFAGFRERVPAQLVLGAAFFFGLVAAIGGSALADVGVLARWMLTGQQPAAEVADAAPLYLAMGAAALVYAPVMMMLWFSPLLVAWHAMAPAKALFYSFFACWLNWRAFLHGLTHPWDPVSDANAWYLGVVTIAILAGVVGGLILGLALR